MTWVNVTSFLSLIFALMSSVYQSCWNWLILTDNVGVNYTLFRTVEILTPILLSRSYSFLFTVYAIRVIIQLALSFSPLECKWNISTQKYWLNCIIGLKLAGDRERYALYFKWKLNYTVASTSNWLVESQCRICTKLTTLQRPKVLGIQMKPDRKSTIMTLCSDCSRLPWLLHCFCSFEIQNLSVIIFQ